MNTEGEKRSIRAIIDSTHTFEGAGFPVTRPFPTQRLMDCDPFLLLDEMGPMQLAPGENTGAPDHPHRGFETVTYLFSGEMEHKDSQGNIGKLKAGDVQWMTAGAGVIHSELTPESFNQSGGTLHGVQLWVNLPSSDKMMQPRYQDIVAHQMPIAISKDGLVQVKVLAGQSLGVQAVIETRIPIMYLHMTLQPGGTITQQIPDNFNTFAYIIDGSATIGIEQASVEDSQMAMLEPGCKQITLNNSVQNTKVCNLLLIGGKPIGEKVVRYGPFVMNSEAEINQAISDYRRGQFGTINV